MDPWMFILYFVLQFNTALCFVHCSLPLAAGNSFSRLAGRCNMPRHGVTVGVWAVCWSLHDPTGLSCICCALILALAISPEPWLLLRESGMSNQDLRGKCACYSWCPGASGPSQLPEQGKTWHLLMPVCPCTCTYF